MKSRHILTALATASLVLGGQAIAQGRGGGHGGGIGAGLGRGGDMGRMDRQPMEMNHGRQVREEARINARGPDRANARALQRANENSVLRDGTIVAPDLDDLAVGLDVYRDGSRIGTVSRVIRTRDGLLRNVLVAGADGQPRIIRLRPDSVSLDGGIVIVTDDD